ncbi:HD domain-containing phosphohydrolase [Methylobacterium sp. J-076]|uniref:HD domain-containing phosphohydrolase n=1 Tax=Methylobacterium sp. J-076 TaxID=2836655 RepID=UPI001FBA3609|nr:HD domain-containing phosphohydrolase [Methylobacterium sp. J-076]MCJ2011765.1 response regulator [Methylobacterium sp. J-076]
MDVLLVDDSTTVLMRLQRLLEAEHAAAVVAHNDPLAALIEGRTRAFDLVLVDQNMPEMDGISLIRELRTIAHYAQVPIAMITADASEVVRLAALEAGATDFLDKRAKGIEMSVRLRNLVRLANAVRRLDEAASSMAGEIERATRHLHEREAEVIFRLALAVEYRDNDTGDHTWRVARYSQIIAKALGLEPEFCWRIKLAAPLHDVGKVAVPDGILLKKGRLDEAEFAVIRTHPVVGKRILDGSACELIQLAAIIAEAHHERWDGGGYPHGLAGLDIPLPARIVAVADVFDALTTARPYKAAMEFEEAFRCVQAERGKHFDPACVDAFASALDDVRAVHSAKVRGPLATLLRSIEPWARIPELPREVAAAE